MSDAPKTPSREERLAQKLRENLHRRKAQARAQADAKPSSQSGKDTPPTN